MKFIFNKEIKGKDIKRFREANNLSLLDLAELLSMSKRSLERYEYQDCSVSGPIVALLRILSDDSDLIEKYMVEKQKYPLRLYYYSGDDISTIIDVSNIERKVKFKNYTDDIIKRAFGVKEKVSYEEYEKFLESRCFPRNRDKIKIFLNEINVPFYDPYLIIKKTAGRMVDDNHWIKIGDNDD